MINICTLQKLQRMMQTSLNADAWLMKQLKASPHELIKVHGHEHYCSYQLLGKLVTFILLGLQNGTLEAVTLPLGTPHIPANKLEYAFASTGRPTVLLTGLTDLTDFYISFVSAGVILSAMKLSINSVNYLDPYEVSDDLRSQGYRVEDARLIDYTKKGNYYVSRQDTKA